MTRRASRRETPADKRVHTRGIEVGQIFYFGEKYSKPMKALDHRAGRRRAAGPDAAPTASASRRLVGALIEANHDDAGIIWPEAVAPFRVGIANLKVGDAADRTRPAQKIYARARKGQDRRAL